MDALFVFLSIHLCICQRAASRPDPIKKLNARFMEICAQFFEDLKAGCVCWEQLPDRWYWALNAYTENRSNFAFVLPQLAMAHICDDLPRAIMEVKQQRVHLTREGYNEVLEDILYCVHQAYARPPLSESLKDQFFHELARLSGGEHWILEEFRVYAWAMAERSLELKDKITKIIARPRQGG